ncbi:alkaline phosphatase family protein [Phytomonospora endophytica]|uniref:Nucleotide pyrophosphatase n=1 Tax=Phytomonospora endophytica TaxID=714109 RepID=A0A841FTW5_9ACTN|nr:alkaline phosphatase family protein [Phytomonospora endophytica]MBB6035969.1 hypothetical protein [Phytomonospora endophytica]GIG66875.1 hypothetical protein Pen01_31700 [Phytomonospora endophytica]
MKRRTALAAAITAVGATLLPRSASAAALTPKVLVIGVDGLLATRIDAANAPHLKAMRANGIDGRSLLYAAPMAATSSGPGWATILTGVWPDKHKVVDNSFGGNALGSFPDWVSRAKAARPSLDTYAAVDWKPIADRILGTAIDTRHVFDGDADGYVGHDRTIADLSAAHLRDDRADASFVYFGQVDIVGHNSGAASQTYLNEIARIDGYIGRLVAAVNARPTRAQESWRIIVTTDHGHTPGGGHGGNSPDERTTFVLLTGDGITRAAPKTTRLVDVAATALAHLGVAAPSTADGRPATVVSSDPFDTVALGPAVDEAVDASILGWTAALPSGWTRENTAMSGGMTEWRGWSLTSDAFWSAAQRGQGRETFVRGRGTIAVADCDEWADRSDATGKTFDSTLWTPARTVSGTAVKVTMTHWYRHEGDQRGYLLARWNGGAATVLRTYSTDSVNGTETVTAAVPSGATNVRIGFRLVGVNNWYWAVDDVRIS